MNNMRLRRFNMLFPYFNSSEIWIGDFIAIKGAWSIKKCRPFNGCLLKKPYAKRTKSPHSQNEIFINNLKNVWSKDINSSISRQSIPWPFLTRPLVGINWEPIGMLPYEATQCLQDGKQTANKHSGGRPKLFYQSLTEKSSILPNGKLV